MSTDIMSQEAHILVVEDDGEMRTLIAKLLRQNGYRVTQTKQPPAKPGRFRKEPSR